MTHRSRQQQRQRQRRQQHRHLLEERIPPSPHHSASRRYRRFDSSKYTCDEEEEESNVIRNVKVVPVENEKTPQLVGKYRNQLLSSYRSRNLTPEGRAHNFHSLDGLQTRKDAKKRKEARFRYEKKDSTVLTSRRENRDSLRKQRGAVDDKSFRRALAGFDLSYLSCLPEDTVVPVKRSKVPVSSTTREELFKLKLELRHMKNAATWKKTSSINHKARFTDQSGKTYGKKHVHFAAPVVTKVSYRPFTDPEEIPLLYFQEEELDVLEWDRETVDFDQFECNLDETDFTISVAHRRRTTQD